MKMMPEFMFTQVAKTKSQSDTSSVMNRKQGREGWFNER